MLEREYTSKELLKMWLPEDNTVSDGLLDSLLLRAENAILDRIGREILPERLYELKASLALIYYNRLGTEGEIKRKTGDIDMSFDSGIPLEIEERLKNYPRRVGVMNAVNSQKP
ncbi:MAG: phage head-tail connector protein [Ruminiclostridium sp.]